jgi:hypothetical protein
VIAEIQRGLDAYSSRVGIEQARATALERWRQANGVLRTHEQLERQAGIAAAALGNVLGTVYRNPSEARTAIERIAGARGWATVGEEIRRAAELFGELRGQVIARRATRERAEALRSLPSLAARTHDYLAARDLVWRSWPEVSVARRTAADALAEAEARTEQIQRQIDANELLDRLNRLMGELSPDRADDLRRKLTADQADVLSQAAAVPLSHALEAEQGL